MTYYSECVYYGEDRMQFSRGEWLASLLSLTLCLLLGLMLAQIWAPQPVVGVIRFDEAITLESADRLIEITERARSDDRVAAVVLEVLSPGGFATSSENIFYAQLQLRETKPLIVVVDSLAVSGGYYMAIAGNQIFSPASSFVGNVGTRGARPGDPSISPEELSTGPFKLTGGARFDRIRHLQLVADAFIENVANQRRHAAVNPLSVDEATIAEARIYLGSEALAMGLIDREGSRSDAIEAAAELAGVPNYAVVDLADYLGLTPEEPALSVAAAIQLMLENVPPDAVFLLDSRIALPGVNDDSALERQLLMLRAIDPASMTAREAGAPATLPSLQGSEN